MNDRKKPCVAFWATVALVVVLVAYPRASANPDEHGKAPPPGADSMLGTKAGQVRDDNGLKMKLVWCPPGDFTMGSPKSEKDRNKDEDQVGVTLTRGFWLGNYEITQGQWKQTMGTTPWKDSKQAVDYVEEGAEVAAAFISWNDATDFCHKLTAQEQQAGRLSTEWEYVLPTEAEWEYACRARTETRFSFGDDESKLGDFEWYLENACKGTESNRIAFGYAHRVGRKKANPWNLFDMHGNVLEWCRDIYTKKLPGGRDPDVKSDEKPDGSHWVYRVYRGGGWRVEAYDCRSALRGMATPDIRRGFMGFRVALSSVR